MYSITVYNFVLLTICYKKIESCIKFSLSIHNYLFQDIQTDNHTVILFDNDFREVFRSLHSCLYPKQSYILTQVSAHIQIHANLYKTHRILYAQMKKNSCAHKHTRLRTNTECGIHGLNKKTKCLFRSLGLPPNQKQKKKKKQGKRKQRIEAHVYGGIISYQELFFLLCIRFNSKGRMQSRIIAKIQLNFRRESLL